MIIVLDSNAAIEIILKRKNSMVFKELLQASEKTVSSEFYRIEVANVIKKYYFGKFINKSEGTKILEMAENLIDEFVPIKENRLEALNEALRLNYPAYDMLYFTLARSRGATLLTLDRGLNLIAKKEGIDIAPVE